MRKPVGLGEGRKLPGGFVQHGNSLVERTKPDLIAANRHGCNQIRAQAICFCKCLPRLIYGVVNRYAAAASEPNLPIVDGNATDFIAS